MLKLLLITKMSRWHATIQPCYSNFTPSYWLTGLNFPKGKEVIVGISPYIYAEMGGAEYEAGAAPYFRQFSLNMTTRHIGFVPHPQEWCDCRRLREGDELTIHMNGGGLNLEDGTIPQSCGVVTDWTTARKSRLCSIRITDPAYADWNAHKSPKFGDTDAQRRNCGTLLEHWLSTALRVSILHQR